MRSKSAPLPAPLKAGETYLECSPAIFKFTTTSRKRTSHDIIAQDRAVRAINMGLGIRRPGYNIYVAGDQGTGKTSVIKTFLETWSSSAEAPCDWVYVYDFNAPEIPQAIGMAAGEGKRFKKKMEQLVKALREDIPTALQSEDYENAVNAFLSASNDRKSKLYSDLEKRAKNLDFQIKSTRMGIETIPVVEGRVLTEKEYSKLSDEQREGIEDKRSLIEPEVLEFARKVRAIEQETKEYVEKLRYELGRHVTGLHIDPIKDICKGNKEILAYLDDVRDHILEHLLDFVEAEEAPATPEEEPMPVYEERDRFMKYRVNLFIDNTKTKGAPVIIETNPTYYNLFGKIEKNVEHGMYLTDFTMIKAGSIHRASGGYLVLNALDIFRNGSIWETLKRVLKNRLGYIEDMGEQYSLLPTSGLRPQPIPLDVKVILIGNDDAYHTLFDLDEDFQKIFKIKADFDYKMPRSKENIHAYVDFIATRTSKESLLPFDRSGVAAVVEYGSRLVEDQRLLSTQFGQLKDLTIEADFIAREQGSKIVKRDHVEEAIDQRYGRLNLVEDHMLEMVRTEDILLAIEGERVGQVNGLAVYDMGDYSFGKIGRVTCTWSATSDGIVNVERQSKLSGKIHDKGIYILSGFLNSLLARERSMGVALSVCFEQSYGLIDGDSATITELVAMISALSDIPVRQNIAMTGSLNQFGEIQPIGGVNDKIEGFFKTCQMMGKKKPCQVLIPYQNVPNLVLHREVRQAVAQGQLKIFPIRYAWQAFELATGVPLGIKSMHDGAFAPHSALSIVQKKLADLHAKRRESQRHGKKD